MKKCRVYEDGDYKEVAIVREDIKFENRMVAFLDVLGFKAKLENSDNVDVAKIYSKLLGIINDINYRIPKDGNKLCNLYVFSDSVILISNGNSNKDIAEFISAVWKFLQSSIAIEMPFRGGISYGEIYVNEEEKVFLGNPIVRAVKMEGKQEWIGIACDGYAENRICNIKQDKSWETIVPHILLVDYDVPFKEGIYERRKVINWRFNIVAENGIKNLLDSKCDRKDVKLKIENTLKFCKFVRDSGKVYLSDSAGEEIHEKCACMHVGKSKPPFKNGDEY